MDRILIIDLSIQCVIGVDDDERCEKQTVVFNIALETDLRKAGKSDQFRDALDYRALKNIIIAEVEASSFYLLEALAEHVAEICLRNSAVETAHIRVEKPLALRSARSVGVEIERTRTH
jgi:D-erythro-7,8-dihydroneopterin triphosphate epimerase